MTAENHTLYKTTRTIILKRFKSLKNAKINLLHNSFRVVIFCFCSHFTVVLIIRIFWLKKIFTLYSSSDIFILYIFLLTKDRICILVLCIRDKTSVTYFSLTLLPVKSLTIFYCFVLALQRTCYIKPIIFHCSTWKIIFFQRKKRNIQFQLS